MNVNYGWLSGLSQILILLDKRREWMGMGVAGVIINDYYGSVPHSLNLAPVSDDYSPNSDLRIPNWLANEYSTGNPIDTQILESPK